MADVKAIELKGITHNTTKIGAQDGQSEDLVNLRFKDGSWRASGDGYELPNVNASGYEQIFIHTNVYRHMLGVKNGKLWWFASAPESDPNNFTMLVDDDEEYAPVELTSVAEGDVRITQTGHLITIIDEEDDFEFFVYKTNVDKYIEFKVDVNGQKSDRNLYPFNQVHFNLHEPLDEDHTIYRTQQTDQTIKTAHEYMVTSFGEAREKNLFTRPFLVIAACRLYDGSHAFISNPTLMFPRQAGTSGKSYFRTNGSFAADNSVTLTDEGERNTSTDEDGNNYEVAYVFNAPISPNVADYTITDNDNDKFAKRYSMKAARAERSKKDTGRYDSGNLIFVRDECVPVYCQGVSSILINNTENTSLQVEDRDGEKISERSTNGTYVFGSDLVMSLADRELIERNAEIITGISIFVTAEADIYNMDSDEGYKKSPFYIDGTGDKAGEDTRLSLCGSKIDKMTTTSGVTEYQTSASLYFPQRRTDDEVMWDLLHSPFYLLKTYDKNNISDLENPIVDLSTAEYKGLLTNITQQDTLKTESFSRVSYLPRYAYSYNGRLHIANYKTNQFHGYPLDMFQKNNHSVKYSSSTQNQFLGLENLIDNGTKYTQGVRNKNMFYTSCIQDQGNDEYYDNCTSFGTCFAYAKVTIETSNGEQTAVRYIPPIPFDADANSLYLEDLDPFLCFPDYRAKSMDIKFVQYNTATGDVKWFKKTFTLKPHPYLNVAYHMSDTFKPIKIGGNDWDDWSFELSDFDLESTDIIPPAESNMQENFPNAVKASSTENPMYFPVASTYQIGSSEVVAMCANAIAVGTGQTGEAPLYIFTKDGIYALFVDASGEMAYTNARVIARDVCNNADSVTPIDAGVVFTTDRGLMMIAGNEVQEIGQPLEGDYVKFGVSTSADYEAVCRNSFTNTLLSSLSSDALQKTDFLTYLKHSIVAYNHNERELMVANTERSQGSPVYDYTYVLDRDGNWSRRDYTADQFVENYPVTYRLRNGKLIQLDKDSDAANGIYWMSRPIKLDSIGFKSVDRVVVRGYFETLTNKYLGLYVLGSYDARKFACLGHSEKKGSFTDIGCNVERTDCRYFRLVLAGQISKDSRLDYMEVSEKQSRLSTKIR